VAARNQLLADTAQEQHAHREPDECGANTQRIDPRGAWCPNVTSLDGLADASIAKRCNQIRHHSECDEYGSKPRAPRTMVRLWRQRANGRELAEKQPKTSNGESKSHECDAGPNPRQHRPLVCLMQTQRLLGFGRRLDHVSSVRVS
jgi:hypothetical protein